MAEAYNAHHRIYPHAERTAFGRGLLETVTYFLRPHIVTPEAHRAGQRIAQKSYGATMSAACNALTHDEAVGLIGA